MIDRVCACLRGHRDAVLDDTPRSEVTAASLDIRTEHCKMARGDASETAEGCGSAYYRYGAALFYRAQEEQDVFGDDMKTAAQQRDVQVPPAPTSAAVH